MTVPKNTPSTAPPFTFSMIWLLFLSSRLMLLLAFPPENLIAYGDFPYYFDLAALTEQGFYPFVDYWQEYPPLFPYINIIIYNLAGQAVKNHIWLLAFILLVVDSGNLYLLYRLALLLRGPARALQVAWIYTAIFVPTIFIFRSFDTITTFFILLALYGLLKQKPTMLGLALGLGAMVKIVPVILVAAIWRMRGMKSAIVYGLVALVISGLILAPLFFLNSKMTTASLLAQPSKSSYQTIWALIDGNETTGSFGPLADHFDPAKATQPLNNPARIPTWLTFIPFGLLGFYLLTRPRRLSDEKKDGVIFTTLTFTIFFLWSPGWSPQWQTFFIPLLLLALPEKRAILFIVILGFINFLEWPVILSRGLTTLLSITILARTFILALLTIELYRLLMPGIIGPAKNYISPERA